MKLPDLVYLTYDHRREESDARVYNGMLSIRSQIDLYGDCN